jgi:hypothetical protein
MLIGIGAAFYFMGRGKGPEIAKRDVDEWGGPQDPDIVVTANIGLESAYRGKRNKDTFEVENISRLSLPKKGPVY